MMERERKMKERLDKEFSYSDNWIDIAIGRTTMGSFFAKKKECFDVNTYLLLPLANLLYS